MANIDSLSIEITADSQKAVKSLNQLSQSLSTISSALAQVNGIGFGSLTNGIKSITQSMYDYTQSGVKTTDFTRLATQLDKLAKVNTQGLVYLGSGINTINSALGNMTQVSTASKSISDFAKALSKLGSANIGRAVTNIPQLGIAMRDLLTNLSKAPKISLGVVQLTQALANLTKNMSGVKSASSGASKGLDTFTASTNKTQKASKGLASAIGKVYASYWLLFRAFSVFRGAIDMASSLTEVQNVVDKTFGNMSSAFDEFSKKAKDTLGMSELTAKTIGSKFQAMGKTMGIPIEQMSSMSTQLTKLTGDLASFYNMNQEDVAKKLETVFTGMTKPLRAFGLDISQASLKEYALKKGIDASIKSMTQAEKTMLRYMYVMENTRTIQGDFLDTINTWANQCRLLQENIKQLGVTVGQTFINAFKPFIQYLNKILVVVQQFAVKIANALGNIFGWTYEAGGGGALVDLEDDALGVEDALGGANDKAKKLKNTIMGYDELNVMQKPKDDDSSGSGLLDGITGGMESDASTGRWIKKYESDIDSLYQLGKRISEKLREMLGNIEWEKIFSKMDSFGRRIADFLNGQIDEETFAKVGEALANGLNSLVHLVNGFGEQFNFKELGRSIASGINSFFETFDFKLLAHTINVWAIGLLDQMNEAIEHTDWFLVGQKIGTFLAGIDFMKILGKFAENLMEAINGVITAWVGSISVAPITTMLTTLLAMPQLVSIVLSSSLFNKIKDYSKAMKKLGSGAKTLGANFIKLGSEIKGAFSWFNSTKALAGFKDFKNLFKDIKSALNGFSGALNPVIKGLGTVVTVALEFSGVKKVLYDITNQTGSLAGNIAKLVGIITASAGALSLILGVPAGIIVAGITAIVGGIVGIKKAWDEADFQTAIDGIGRSLDKPNGVSVEDVAQRYIESINGISASYETLSSMTVDLTSTKEEVVDTSEKIDLISKAMNNSVEVTGERIPELQALFQTLADDTKVIFEESYNTIYFALAGSLGDAVRDAGHSVSEYLKILESTKSEQEQAYDGAILKISELNKQYEDGTISAEEYETQYMAQVEVMKQLAGETDNLTESLKNTKSTIDTIDFSDMFNGEDGFDVQAFQTNFTQPLGEAYSNAETMINEENQKILDALSYEGKWEEFTKDGTAVRKYGELIEAESVATQKSLEDNRQAIYDASVKVQNQLLQDLSDFADEKEKEYEEKGFLYKMFHTKAGYVEEQMQTYKTEVIDPVTTELETMYDDLGIEASTYAGDVFDGIMANAFEVNEDVYRNGVKVTQKKLEENWNQILDGAVQSIDAEGFGKDTIDGYNRGIEKNSSSTEGYINPWIQKIKDCIHDGYFKYGSPSKTMADYGLWTIQGFNNGIKDNKDLSKNPISTWTSTIKSAFEDNCKAETFSGFAKNVVDGFSNGISSFYQTSKSAVEGWASSIGGWFKNKLDINSPSKLFYEFGGYTVEGYNDAIEDGMSSTKTVMMSWADNIGQFGSMVGTRDVFNGLSANVSVGNQGSSDVLRQAVMDGMMQVVMATSDNNRENGDINLYLDGRVIAQTTYNNLKTMGRQGLIPRFI